MFLLSITKQQVTCDLDSNNENRDSSSGKNNSKFKQTNFSKKTKPEIQSFLSRMNSTEKNEENLFTIMPEIDCSVLQSEGNSAFNGTVEHNCYTTRTLILNKSIDFNIHPSLKKNVSFFI